MKSRQSDDRLNRPVKLKQSSALNGVFCWAKYDLFWNVSLFTAFKKNCDSDCTLELSQGMPLLAKHPVTLF